MNLRKLFLVATAFVLGACATQPEGVDDRPRKAAEDPNVLAMQEANYKLAKQTPTQMYRSMKLPSVNYDFDSIRPPEYAYPILDKVTTLLKEKGNVHLILEGHSDVLGSDEYNYWLSGARASVIKSYLVSRGIEADRIRIHAYGNTRPITLDNSSEGRLVNRRVDMKLTKRDWKSVY
ncbi:MAG: OmpA family protein [Elusimicrobiaceae bacterium]|nr:OmpA family protein [Elusimicrobiaceae bacterium]